MPVAKPKRTRVNADNIKHTDLYSYEWVSENAHYVSLRRYRYDGNIVLKKDRGLVYYDPLYGYAGVDQELYNQYSCSLHEHFGLDDTDLKGIERR